ncbi:hypothetical protein GCM10023238_39450 [Streptomyces heliomycini]
MRRGDQRKITAEATHARASPTGSSSTVHHPAPPDPPVHPDHRVAHRVAGDEHDEPVDQRQARGEREEDGPAVLAGEGAVAFDPVDAVGAPLYLALGGGEVLQGEAQAEPERQLAPEVVPGAAPGPPEGVLDDVGAGAGHDPAEGEFDDPAHALGVHGGRQTDQRHGERHHAEDELEGERPRVGEAVRVAEAGEGVGQQPQAP